MAASAESDPLPSQETTSIPSSVYQKCESELSSRPECSICCHELPVEEIESFYHTCCGQVICNGCVVGKKRTQLKELGKIVEGTTPEEEQFRLIKERGMYVCPYCRAPSPDDEESLRRVNNRIEIRNDRDYSIALNQLGSYYKNGVCGLSQNLKKAEELYKKAYDLDDSYAALNLYFLYDKHYPDQKEKAREYLLRGEMLGNFKCILFLAGHACASDDKEETARLWMKAVCLGGEDVTILLDLYQMNLLSKDDVATTLRANQAVKDEVTTKRRDFAKRYAQFHDAS